MEKPPFQITLVTMWPGKENSGGSCWQLNAPSGKGNGNPLQCSCLENPRDGGAWWAAVYGVAQSRTRLKRLSSSSRICNLIGQNSSHGHTCLKWTGKCISSQSPEARGRVGELEFLWISLKDSHASLNSMVIFIIIPLHSPTISLPLLFVVCILSKQNHNPG